MLSKDFVVIEFGLRYFVYIEFLGHTDLMMFKNEVFRIHKSGVP